MELEFNMTSTGPSIRAVCRIINQNSCGSGSICGIRDGKSLILTNAHVAGTKIGRIVNVEVESTGDKLKGRVIMAAYSDKTVSDWAILETVENYIKVEPVPLSKKRPSGSHYTKGFPKCKPHNGTDITTHSFGTNGVWFWEPDSIGGQSGSGVWSDNDNFCYGLLTWLWNGHGAGQQTAEIYRQAINQTNMGYPRPDGLIECDNDWDYDFTNLNRGDTDPIVENTFVSEMSVRDLPIWAEDIVNPPDPDPDPDNSIKTAQFIEYCRDIEELHKKWREKFDINTNDNDSGNTFGL